MSTPPVSVPEPPPLVLNKAVLVLYLTIVIVLGLALGYSLTLGKDYIVFASSIVTALTTIAGFAVGANVSNA